jgi:hypothetical protein
MFAALDTVRVKSNECGKAIDNWGIIRSLKKVEIIRR